MKRLSMGTLGWSRLIQLSIVGVVVLALAGSEARAWGGTGYYTYASYGGYYGGYAPYGCCNYYAAGPLHRMGARIRARRAYRASYRSAYSWGYCGVGCYSTCCVSVACCNPCGCDPCGCGSSIAYYSPSASCCSSNGGTIIQDEPADSGEVQPTPAEPDNADQNSASINMILPSIAKVYVNDRLTTSRGSHRSFVSRGLRSDLNYSYRVRVEYEQDGKPVVHRRKLKLAAGDRVAIDFRTSPSDTSQLAGSHHRERELVSETKVTLQVPEGAEVYLAGSLTFQQGSQRQYMTTRLAEGELWKDYTVRVVWRKDGKSLTREKTLQVEGGQTYELKFDFNQQNPKLAMLTP